MKAIKVSVLGFLKKEIQFQMPVYQRRYSWTKEQCSRLWDDIVKMEKGNKTGHFIGSIVNMEDGVAPAGVDKYVIIDGQQRLTTLTLLLLALRDHVKAGEDKSIDIKEIEKRVENEPESIEEESDEDRYKLLLTGADREILKNIIENRQIISGAESNLLKNYNFFREKVKNSELKPTQKVYEAIEKLQVVNITLNRDEDDAQAIFESLNSTGKGLSRSDLIRNYVLMDLPINEQNKVYKQYWLPTEEYFYFEEKGLDSKAMDDFFRDYLTMKLADPPKKERVYDDFKLYCKNGEFRDKQIQELYSDMLTFAKYYTDMVFMRRNDRSVLHKLYEDMVELRMKPAYPFLLKVHNDCEKNIITENDLEEIIKLCISYVIRRSVCGIPSNALTGIFATLWGKINKNDYMNSLKAFFVQGAGRTEFPNDEKFRRVFVERDFFPMKNTHFILSYLDSYGGKPEDVIDTKKYSIEHIMPQTLTPKWKADLGDNWEEVYGAYLNKIGNLTLTRYNSEMSNLPFAQKRDMKNGLKESRCRYINNYVCEQEVWKKANIEERTNRLANRALEAWPFPKITPEELAPYMTKG